MKLIIAIFLLMIASCTSIYKQIIDEGIEDEAIAEASVLEKNKD